MTGANGNGIIVRLPLASGLLSGTMSRARQFACHDHRRYHRRYHRDGQPFHVGESFNGMPFETWVGLASRCGDSPRRG